MNHCACVPAAPQGVLHSEREISSLDPRLSRSLFAFHGGNDILCAWMRMLLERDICNCAVLQVAICIALPSGDLCLNCIGLLKKA